jgi:hypothetical protein
MDPSPMNPRRLSILLFASAALLTHCVRPRPAAPPPPEGAVTASPSPTPSSSPEDSLAVRPVADPIVVAAWAEPAQLPEAGGQAQILVRVQKRGGKPYPGVEVRLRTSKGELFSAGRTLVTDRLGLTRDRLTARDDATITLNAGGTRYRFVVPVSSN